MSVASRAQIVLRFLEAATKDLGVASMAHVMEYPPATLNGGSPELATGTGDWQFDTIFSDERTATAAPDPLDLRGTLVSQLTGAALTFVEVGAIGIVNMSTAVASVLSVGAGSNPAFAGLFGATGDIVKVGASGLLLWVAPLDGGGLATTAGTADILTIDPGAATITYRIVIVGRSA
jgi:hypothetical protein